MSNAGVTRQDAIRFQQPEDGLRKALSHRGEVFTPGRVAEGKIDGTGSNEVIQVAKFTVVDLIVGTDPGF
jgi:hypothetical protein